MAVASFPGVASFPTHHCVTGSLRHVYEACGFPISEDLLLGLGSGVGFSYWHFKGTDPFYGGRANFERPSEEGLEKTVGRRTGVVVESHVTSSRRKAEAALIELLERETPVMVYVDMGFLTYLDLPDDYHFGGHTIAVTGYDPEAKSVLVADRDPSMQLMSLDQLELARASTHKPFPPQHKWYTFDFSKARHPTASEVWDSIADVTTGMLDPPISNIGVKGIRTAAKRTRKWPEVLDAEALRRTCFNVAIFIDPTGGTGGGIFRYMYGRFLKEAAEITANKRLASLGEEFRRVGDLWEDVPKRFHSAAEAPDPAAHLEDAVEPLDHIADREHELWEELSQLVP